MNWYRFADCWGPIGVIAAIVAAATVLTVAAWSHLPAEVVVRDCGGDTAEDYVMPRGYRYCGSSIDVTGGVATVTATFRKETAK